MKINNERQVSSPQLFFALLDCPVAIHSGLEVWIRKKNSLGFIYPMHTVPESLYSFRFWFSRISVFYNRKIKKTCEIVEFIPNQLRFHEKNLANFCDMEISLLVLPCHFIG